MQEKQNSVIVIGLDGATWRILDPLLKNNKLPFFKKLITDGLKSNLKSTLPPLTGSSWVSLQTGTHPGKHGIFDFKKRNGQLVNARDIKQPRIWEVLNKRGLRSCVINMPVSYPVKPLNGYLVSSFLTPKNKRFAYPKELEKKLRRWKYKLDLESGFLPEDVPADKKTFQSIQELAKQRLKISRKLLLEEPWNFFFVLIKATDLIQHYDWNGKETQKLYQIIDKELEKMVDGFKKQYPQQKVHLIVMSDHGFHPSAKLDIAIYPLLRELGILPNQSSLKLKLARGWRRFVKQTEKLPKQVTSYGMFVEDVKTRKKIVSQLKKAKYKNKLIFQEVSLAKDLYGDKYAKEIPDILWLMNEEFAPNADPLADRLIYPKKTVLKGHHYADRNGILMVKSPLLKKKQAEKEPQIYEVGSLVVDLLETPAQTMEKHHFYLKKRKFNIEKKAEEAKKIIKQALKTYKNPAIAWTGGKDSTVLLHLVRSVTKKSLPVMFIDHQNHFEETLKFVNKLEKDWQLNLIRVGHKEAIAAYKAETDFQKRKELARVVKIKSIAEAIKKYKWDGLLVGIRWDEHPARSEEKSISKREDHDRIHPILPFTEEDIWNYIYFYDVPYNPLYDMGYRSVGEKEFTQPVFQKGAGERAGREKEKEEIMEKLRKLGYF